MSNNNCLTEQEITLYCTGDLGREQHRAAQEHFVACRKCRTTMAATRRSLAAVTRPELQLSAAEQQGFTDRVMRAAGKRARGPVLQAWGAAATALAAGIVAVMLFGPGDLPTNTEQNRGGQYAELDLVENMEMLEELELLEMMEMLELLEDES